MYGLIYKIVNLVTSDFYVGSTNKFSVRRATHKQRLKKNRHHCAHLQNAWNKYGSAAFAFVVVEEIDSQDSLFEAEQRWLDAHVGKSHCYNHSKTADAPWRGVCKEQHPRFGAVISQQAREQISATLKEFYKTPENHPRYGKTHTDEARQKISENRKGKMAGEAHYRYGKTVSDEVKAKISAAQIGKPKALRILTEEGRKKIADAAEKGHYSHWQGRTHTEAAKLKMSKAVVAIDPNGIETEFESITKLREILQMTAPTVDRALKSGQSISRGVRAGWKFFYRQPR